MVDTEMRRGIVSLISHGIGYLQGACVLGRSIGKWAPDYPRVLLVEDRGYTDRQIGIAESAGWEIKIVQPVRVPKCDFTATRWVYTFTKLRIWELDEFDQAIYLDADCMAVGEFAERMFKCPELMGACWVSRDLPNGFNSGSMTIRPDAELAEQMIHDVRTKKPAQTRIVLGDQGYLNKRFAGHWYQFPDKYNRRHHLGKYGIGDPRIVHLRPHPWSNKGRRLVEHKPSYWHDWQQAKDAFV